MIADVLIVAAGQGIRAGGSVPKQFELMDGTALVAHAFDAFNRHPAIRNIVIVVAPDQHSLLQHALAGRCPSAIVNGGAERQNSVYSGLSIIDSEAVLVHDAARPIVPSAVIDALLLALETHEGAVPSIPVVDTLANANGSLGENIPRAGIMRVQTPQAFRTSAIRNAHENHAGLSATDDAQLLRLSGRSVAVVAGDPILDKITFPGDLKRMETFLSNSRIVRTGIGFDVHRLENGPALFLCGLEIAHDKGLAGHSDADVALHAVVDALLGAIGQGDIGDHFPPSDPQWRGAASSQFIGHACWLVEQAAGRIDHVDLTIICEEPKIGPYRAAMRTNLASLLNIAEASVNVKATTTERLGFTGRGEGIAAQAIATISMRTV